MSFYWYQTYDKYAFAEFFFHENWEKTYRSMIWSGWATKNNEMIFMLPVSCASISQTYSIRYIYIYAKFGIGENEQTRPTIWREMTEKRLCPQIECSMSAPKFKGSVSFISFISFIFFIWTATLVSLAGQDTCSSLDMFTAASRRIVVLPQPAGPTNTVEPSRSWALSHRPSK